MILLGACAHGHQREDAAGDEALDAYPANYKPDILAAMHAYLNDPSGIRDTGISDPMLKPVGNVPRYVVCVRFNPRSGHGYGGVREIAAVFVAGRFDRFVESAHEQCDAASFAAFPALEKLAR